MYCLMADETARVRKLTVSLHFLKHTLSSTLWPYTFTYLKMQLLSYPTATLIGVQSKNKRKYVPSYSCSGPPDFFRHHK